MVIDRLGTDLQKRFEESGKRFPRKLVLQLGLRLVGYSLPFNPQSMSEQLVAIRQLSSVA